MDTVSQAVHSWWRYSGFTPLPAAAITLGLIGLWCGAALSHWSQAQTVIAVIATGVVAVFLAVGAVRAERARRFGCW